MPRSSVILAVLDACSEKFTFPMLDNGYVYPAATRLSAYRDVDDWAIVIEVFGFSPRAGIPDTSIYTFANRINHRSSRESFVSEQAHQNYLSNNPNNEMNAVFPIAEGSWQDPDESEVLRECADHLELRDRTISLPERSEYENAGIELIDGQEIQVFECCRYLANHYRELVLCTESERRANLFDNLSQVVQLEEWNHPDLVVGEKPGENETFQQLANLLETGNLSAFKLESSPNTHWSNWPDGGTL